jgi:Mn2+/Fe2+ NRAMP family transporter
MSVIVNRKRPARAPVSKRARLLRVLGPGLITGASDDDPSGIGTYSQAGAQFGFAISWTMLFSYPLMVAIQQISARIDARARRAGMAGASAMLGRTLRRLIKHGRLTIIRPAPWPMPTFDRRVES